MAWIWIVEPDGMEYWKWTGPKIDWDRRSLRMMSEPGREPGDQMSNEPDGILRTKDGAIRRRL